MAQDGNNFELDAPEFPNTIKRRRTLTARPDDMADTGAPASTSGASASKHPAPANGTNDSVAGDADTCRICRGEGTTSEPLFYPCKCSGSIKFVHQDCLMEWLSHSQKKHCELCKTPFRFTKLYSPDMPKRLPFYIFVSHMAKYLLRNILVWLRAALVISVWLGWLPYLMRAAWSFLFWISDQGFGPAPQPFPRSLKNGTSATLAVVANHVTGQGLTSTTCPSSPLFRATTTAAVKSHIAEKLPDFLQAIGSGLNTTDSNTFTTTLLRMIFRGTGLMSEKTAQLQHVNTTLRLDEPASPNSYPTLLSEVQWLKNLTRHPGVNQTIISVVEGQIITILVIVCFILIILVRDYVVQQQPEINMRAAFAAQENNINDQPPVDGAPNLQPELGRPERGDEILGDDDSMTAHFDEGENRQPETQWRPDEEGPSELRQRPIADFTRRLSPRDAPEESANDKRTPDGPSISHPGLEPIEEAHDGLHEASLDRQPQTTINQYLRIYREADGDREKILRIIHNEGLEDRLAYWVSVTQSVAKSSKGGNGSPSQASQFQFGSQGDSSGDIVPHENGEGEVDRQWPSSGTAQEPDEVRDSKGKGKEVDGETIGAPTSTTKDTASQPRSGWEYGWKGGSENHWNAPENSIPFSSLSSRPRAISDGPQHHESINPLANNNWSFSGLPPTADRVLETRTASEAGPSAAQQIPSWTSSQHSTNISHHPDEISTHSSRHDEVDDVGRETEDTADTSSWVDMDDHETTIYRDEASDRPLDEDESMQALPAPRHAGLVDRVADFMWGDVENEDIDGMGANAIELFIDDQNAPFINANQGQEGDEGEEEDDNDPEDEEIAPDVLEAAVAAGIDPEAIDDAEDFDGIMELIGMRGPIAGLLQNAIFCAFLVSITIFLGIFMPYNIGRLAVWVVANPMRLVHMVFSFSKFIQDVCLFVVGWTSNFMFDFLAFMCKIFRIHEAHQFLETVSADAKLLTTESFDRLWGGITSEFALISSNEIRNFSAVSHVALISVKGHVHLLLTSIGNILAFVFGGDYAAKWALAKPAVVATVPLAIESLKNFTAGLSQPKSWMINLNLPEFASEIDSTLSYWGAKDRTLATLGGYITICVIAGLYLGRGTPFSSGQTAQDWEASIIDALNQASGVMKVILIISIEMLIFPLYCGLLLDFALLPLFESTSFKSRLWFTYNFPLTSIFVHWFVGTGYMFHFALFVSMCRKIMRKGVLYFIRDPDDREFHPVRDVLERNVTTQLRKILFSAFVYGALVVICLGGVVWGLALALPHVLPIHYSSNEPVLEFPIDLLFYNFLMPLAVKFFKPSNGLHAMYTWWFRKCARTLRLTWFLFGERRVDEEGILQLDPASPHNASPWYCKLFLEVSKSNEVIPKTWADTFEGGKAKPTSKIEPEEMSLLSYYKIKLVNSGQLIPDGRFVRTPASDQVKIPKGQPVFLNVAERDVRAEGTSDGLQSNLLLDKNYQTVYVPPRFRVRIFLFILFIWIFAAVTGVGFTIVPLMFGRQMFNLLIPSHIRTNDIYAFSIGVYVLGSFGYFVFHARRILSKIWDSVLASARTFLDRDALRRISKVSIQCARLGYAYGMLLVVFPLLVTVIMELYVLMPLHTWKYSQVLNEDLSSGNGPSFNSLKDGHTIRVIQAWTLGILYLKLGSRALVLYGGRPAQAVRAVFRRGWLEPDMGVFTRAFVIPGLLLSVFLVLFPPFVTQVAIKRGLLGSDSWAHEKRVVMFRMSYPIATFCWAAAWALRGMMGVLDGWRARVRDEAYLMGERLHNFGGLVGTKGTTAGARGEWRGGARL